MNDAELMNRYMAHAESVSQGASHDAMDESELNSAAELDRIVRDDPDPCLDIDPRGHSAFTFRPGIRICGRWSS